MKNHPQLTPIFAVCVSNSDYPASLELHKIYQLLPDDDAADDGDVRVVDESGEDYLYPAECFATIELPKTVAQSVLTTPQVREAVTSLDNNRLARECAKLDATQEQILADEGLASEFPGWREQDPL